MQITQGQFTAQVNDERGGAGFTRGEATDMLLLAKGSTLKEIGRATAAHRKPSRPALAAPSTSWAFTAPLAPLPKP